MAMDPIDPDVALMLAFQKGDDLAFEQLLDKYYGPIVNFVYRFVNDRSDAEELAQEVFLRVHRARGSYEPRARFSSWLYKIATNVALKAARKSRRMPLRNPAEAAQDSGGGNDIPDPRPNAESVLADEELEKAVRSAIEALPKNEKLALILRRYQGLSYREIAAAMNCSEGAVKTYLHRGKLRARRQLLPYLEKGRI
jgi:RNA polymerase sigma-70 factor (ECF subfamily)